jgi:hypothetical protein
VVAGARLDARPPRSTARLRAEVAAMIAKASNCTRRCTLHSKRDVHLPCKACEKGHAK